jgi:hypothetical protein
MKITKEILKEWNACKDGFDVFCELMPKGATLETAIKKLDKSGHGFDSQLHNDWSYWLFDRCSIDERFKKFTVGGYRNSGYRNSGNWNSGYRNSGNWNSGDSNSGYRNSGNRNSGNWNSGDWNSGDSNSGYRNSGNRNSGNWNSGDSNSGYRNSGNWNSGDSNSGFFNTKTPAQIYVFDVLCNKEDFEKWEKPKFLQFDLCVWVDESKMTAEQKTADPNFFARGGQLQTKA